MAFKLKDLLIKKVDLVNEGANPFAHIRLFKSKNGKTGVQKDADSFNDKLKDEALSDIVRQIWMYCDAISCSLIEIMRDDETQDKAKAMLASLEQFYGATRSAVELWADGKMSDFTLGEPANSEAIDAITGFVIKRVTEGLEENLEKNFDGLPVMFEKDNNEGGQLIMKFNFDESKLTDEEKAQLSAIQKKAGIDEGTDPVPPAPAGGEGGAGTDVNKSKENNDPVPPAPATSEGSEGDDIYKGLNPTVAAELKALKKYREESETRELETIASKYEIIGKKKEDLVPLFKSLKAAGGTAFDDMIAVLDSTVETVNKSGAFTEVGKSGHGGGENSAEAKIAAIAKGYMEKDPTLDQSTAVAKAWENNPDLFDQYDEEAGN